MILAVRGSLRGITHRHVGAVLRLAAEAQSGRHLVLPGGCVARREFEWLIVGQQCGRETPSDYAYTVEPPAEVCLPALGTTLRFKIVAAEASPPAYNRGEEVGLDLAKLPGGLVLRNWRAGDRFQPQGSRKPLKVKELFRERRIAAERRSHWPVLECGKGIVWVRGFPAAASVAPGVGTVRVMLISEVAERADRSRREQK
jgi:tRNA(Ile)-lysidine synthase